MFGDPIKRLGQLPPVEICPAWAAPLLTGLPVVPPAGVSLGQFEEAQLDQARAVNKLTRALQSLRPQPERVPANTNPLL